jgi:hypothetical protein
MVEFMQRMSTVTPEVYELRRAIQTKRHGMLTYGVALLRDNARPYTSTAACTRALLKHFSWELFDRPPYSSDLAAVCYLPEERAGIAQSGVKWPGRETDHSYPTSAEVKKTWIYTSALPYVFMA